MTRLSGDDANITWEPSGGHFGCTPEGGDPALGSSQGRHDEQATAVALRAEDDAAHRAKLEQFEAFVFKERGEIYLNGHGKVSAEAIAGRPHGVYVLAAILAHEMAHLQGLDERGALEAERRCVFQFMKEGRIPVDVALEHFRGMWRLRQ